MVRSQDDASSPPPPPQYKGAGDASPWIASSGVKEGREGGVVAKVRTTPGGEDDDDADDADDEEDRTDVARSERPLMGGGLGGVPPVPRCFARRIEEVGGDAAIPRRDDGWRGATSALQSSVSTERLASRDSGEDDWEAGAARDDFGGGELKGRAREAREEEDCVRTSAPGRGAAGLGDGLGDDSAVFVALLGAAAALPPPFVALAADGPAVRVLGVLLPS